VFFPPLATSTREFLVIQPEARLWAARAFFIERQRNRYASRAVAYLLYVIGPYPNEVFALDATTGDLKWIMLDAKSGQELSYEARRDHTADVCIPFWDLESQRV
jgi:hypothetical protein